jgi:hypothetical protein
LSEANGLDGVIELTTIGFTLRLSELYENAIAHDDAGVFQHVVR